MAGWVLLDILGAAGIQCPRYLQSGSVEQTSHFGGLGEPELHEHHSIREQVDMGGAS